MPESSTADDTVSLASTNSIDANALGQFWFVVAMYVGWSLLIWFSQFTGSMLIDAGSVRILLFGAGATNILFYLICRGDLAHRPPADAMSLAQCVVGIAWATLLTFMSSDTGALAIGIYVSIVLFAMPRVSQPILSQIILFAIISYSMINFVKILVTESQSIAAEHLYQMLIFAGTMLCLSSAGKYVFRKQQQLEAGYLMAQANLRKEVSETNPSAYSRRYLFETLIREKGRTDRKNVPFSLCIFGADFTGDNLENVSDRPDSDVLQPLEEIIRADLRDMDAVNRAEICNHYATSTEQKIYVLLPETNLPGARRTAERLLATATAKLDLNIEQITFSVGIAQYRRGEQIDDLLMRAENALLQARQPGADNICDHEHNDIGQDRADVVNLSSRRR